MLSKTKMAGYSLVAFLLGFYFGGADNPSRKYHFFYIFIILSLSGYIYYLHHYLIP
jgi:hypothetical protein